MVGVLLLLFVGSGGAALIYELLWFQMLGLVLGVSSVSLGIVLATFMGGMGLGALLLPRLVPAGRHPLRVYAALEAGIALCAALLYLGLPVLARHYPEVPESLLEPGAGTLALRALVSALCLLPPTVLMGATLPAIARLVVADRVGMARLGLFYGGNIAGAALGTLLAGFYLLRFHPVGVATAVAMAINLGVALLALWLAGRLPHRSSAAPARAGARPSRAASAAAVVVFLSGATALAAQVIWTRQLALFIGATVYGFALILAVFLVGLGVGASLGSTLARRAANPALSLAVCQLALCLAIAWAAHAVTQELPYWPVNEALRIPADLLRAAWALAPATMLWGASFPLALAAAVGGEGRGAAADSGRVVGRLYAANTLGAILGALGATFWAVPALGSQWTQQSLVLLALAAAVVAALMAARVALPAATVPRQRLAVPAIILLLALVAALLGVRSVPPIPAQVIAAGHYLPDRGRDMDVIWAREGFTASVAVSREPNGELTYHNSGKVQASSYPRDMRLQRMLGHFTSLLPENRQEFLVIGLGAGVTAGAIALDTSVGHITVAELEPLVAQVATRWFRPWNQDVINDPRVTLRLEDGRHFLQTTDRTFDGITSDPLDPWTRGSAALYTEEFWRLAKSRLNPGGVVTAWGQLYESTEESARSVIATFMQVFPNSAIFANTVQGEGYDMVLLGMHDGDTIAVDRLRARLAAAPAVRASLAAVGFDSALDLLSTYAGGPADLAPWLRDAQLNRDRDMRLQYLAGWGSKRYDQAAIFDRMLARGVAWPPALFSGPPSELRALEERIRRHQGRFH